MSDLNVYTTSQINALTPITGDMVVDSDLNAVKLYDGAAWRVFNSDSTATPFQNRWGASFDSSNYEQLLCGSTSAISSDITISCWMNASSFPAAYNTLVGAGGLSNSKRLWLNCNSSRFRFYNGSGYIQISYALSTATWYHVVAVVSGTNHSIYVNGSQIHSASASTLIAEAGDDITIGASPIYPTLFNFDGEIDDVSVFNTALSAPDISKIYNGTAPNGKPTDLTLASAYDTDRTSNLVGYWRMGDDSSDSPVDAGLISGITNTANPGTNDATTVATSQPTFSALASSETIYS